MKFYLRRVRLNSGGYDSDGYYWGTGIPLYRYWNDEEGIDYEIRAYDRTDAKAKILLRLDYMARFYR